MQCTAQSLSDFVMMISSFTCRLFKDISAWLRLDFGRFLDNNILFSFASALVKLCVVLILWSKLFLFLAYFTYVLNIGFYTFHKVN